jgi:hypothetical protein
VEDKAERHREAAKRHAKAARIHAESVEFWREQGDERRAELHRRATALKEALAQLEVEWADLIEADTADDVVV